MKIQDITNMVLKQLRGGGRVIYFDPGDGVHSGLIMSVNMEREE